MEAAVIIFSLCSHTSTGTSEPLLEGAFYRIVGDGQLQRMLLRAAAEKVLKLQL